MSPEPTGVHGLLKQRKLRCMRFDRYFNYGKKEFELDHSVAVGATGMRLWIDM